MFRPTGVLPPENVRYTLNESVLGWRYVFGACAKAGESLL